MGNIIVAGVSGSGKTSVALALAEKLDADFLDADDLHSQQAIQRMTSGIGLTDKERWPWLHRLGDKLATGKHRSTVCACSALKANYRDLLRQYDAQLTFVYLNPDKKILAKRIANRKHFMPIRLLASQLEECELPNRSDAIIVKNEKSIEATVDQIISFLAGSSNDQNSSPKK